MPAITHVNAAPKEANKKVHENHLSSNIWYKDSNTEFHPREMP